MAENNLTWIDSLLVECTADELALVLQSLSFMSRTVVVPTWELLLRIRVDLDNASNNEAVQLFRVGHAKSLPDFVLYNTALYEHEDTVELQLIHKHIATSSLKGSTLAKSLVAKESLPAIASRVQPVVEKARETLKWRKPNAVMYILLDGDRTSETIIAIKNIFKYFNAVYRYPLILFHEDTLEEESKHLIISQLSEYRDAIQFRTITLEPPPSVDKSAIPSRTDCDPDRSTIGYRNMCYFLLYTVHDILRDYEWHFRLDSDSLLISDVGYDIFRLMEQMGVRYGSRGVVREHKQCRSGLREFTDTFAGRYFPAPKFYEFLPPELTFYNNFEVSHRSLWLSDEFRAFVTDPRLLHGVYHERWGDAPLKTHYLAMALPLSQVHIFADVGYVHEPFLEGMPRGVWPFTNDWTLIDAAARYESASERDKELFYDPPTSKLSLHLSPPLMKKGSFSAMGELAAAQRTELVRSGQWFHLPFQQRVKIDRALYSAGVVASAVPAAEAEYALDVALAKRAEILYSAGVARREETVRRLYGSKAETPLFRAAMPFPTYIWDFVWPAWNCPWMERWGAVSDGGKWVCNPDVLRHKSECIVYSFGVQTDVSFEEEVAEETSCQLRLFDPTVDDTPSHHKQFSFRKVGLGPVSDNRFRSIYPKFEEVTLSVNTLRELMGTLGDTHIDLLKVDIEYGEWTVFRQLEEDDFWPFDQLLIEIHLPPPPFPPFMAEEFFMFFDRLEQRGYRVFSIEQNLNPGAKDPPLPPIAAEVCFVRFPSQFAPAR